MACRLARGDGDVLSARGTSPHALEVVCGADAVREEGVRHRLSQLKGGGPAGAVARHEIARLDGLQGRNGLWDELTEVAAGQVEAADYSVDLLNTGQGLGVA